MQNLFYFPQRTYWKTFTDSVNKYLDNVIILYVFLSVIHIMNGYLCYRLHNVHFNTAHPVTVFIVVYLL